MHMKTAPETFTLEESTYRGLPLLKVIEDLTQVNDKHLIPTNIIDSPRVSYSVHTAHKLAAWILHIRSEEFVTSLENRAISIGGLQPTLGIHTSERTIQIAAPYALSQLCCSLLCALQDWRGRSLLTPEMG